MNIHTSIIPLLKKRDDLLTREQAAYYLGIKSSTLATWTCTGRYKLPYVKLGRYIRYRKSDLDEFILRRTRK